MVQKKLDYRNQNELKVSSLNFDLSSKEIKDLMKRIDFVIDSSETFSEMSWNVCSTLGYSLTLEDCSIFEINDSLHRLIQVAIHKENGIEAILPETPLEIPLGLGICGFVALTGMEKLVPSTLNESLYIIDEKFRLSEICVPIKTKKDVIGVIDCESSYEEYFTSSHLLLLNRVANSIGRSYHRWK